MSFVALLDITSCSVHATYTDNDIYEYAHYILCEELKFKKMMYYNKGFRFKVQFDVENNVTRIYGVLD